jgi:hypothetical protein
MFNRTHLACAGFEFTTLVVIDIDCMGSFKSNNHTIMATKAPIRIWKIVNGLQVNVYGTMEIIAM